MPRAGRRVAKGTVVTKVPTSVACVAAASNDGNAWPYRAGRSAKPKSDPEVLLRETVAILEMIETQSMLSALPADAGARRSHEAAVELLKLAQLRLRCALWPIN